MKIFVAGATGALGKPLVTRLVRRGHEVIGMTRSESKQEPLRELGARPVVADALDPDAVARAVAEADPDVIVHQLTAIGALNPRRMERDFAATNRLRTEGTDHLLAAGRAVGVKRFVAQSFAPWPYARTGGPVKSEDDPLDTTPPAQARTTLEAIKYLERAVTSAEWTEGIALRYGGFYGPGTSIGLDPVGEQIEMVRSRKLPIAGKGTGVWSFIHIEDAAAATVEAVEHGKRGVYNVVDDEPAPVSEWLPVLAESLGAKPPRRVPLWLARLAGGEVAAVMMSDLRGSSNDKAKRELGWQPRYPSWREGFARGLGLAMASTDLFEELRPPAFAIAYRMLGSVSEAEDVVQEGLLRLHRTLEHGERIESPRAYVSTVVTRLAIDQLRSARVRRETYTGEWLPEPLVAAEEGDPAWEAELADSLSFAFMVVLESLSPEQRAAFLLREVFDYPYDRIAEIIGKSEENVRQLTARARRHVEEHKPRYEPSAELRNELAQRFIAAAREGELGELEELLAEDVVLHGDGGGKAPALARPLEGRERVSKTLVAWARTGQRAGGVEFRPVEVNGEPGAIALDAQEGTIISVLALEIADGRIQAIRSVVNPDKLRHLGPVADAREFLRRSKAG